MPEEPQPEPRIFIRGREDDPIAQSLVHEFTFCIYRMGEIAVTHATQSRTATDPSTPVMYNATDFHANELQPEEIVCLLFQESENGKKLDYDSVTWRTFLEESAPNSDNVKTLKALNETRLSTLEHEAARRARGLAVMRHFVHRLVAYHSTQTPSSESA